MTDEAVVCRTPLANRMTTRYDTSDADLEQAAAALRAGRLVAFPTETVYGLGALGLDEACLKRLYAGKGRPGNNPVILHTATTRQALSLVRLSNEESRLRFDQLAKRFWPGPLTLVCRKADHIPQEATAGLPKVAVRVPKHPVANRLLQLVEAPLAAPSANVSTRPSATCPEHVLATLENRIDGIVCGGSCEGGMESTVVDISDEHPVVLRPGAITLDQLRDVVPTIRQRDSIQPTATLPSPGTLGKHYAPSIPSIQLVDRARLRNAWNTDAALLLTETTATALRRALGANRSGPTEILSDEQVVYAQGLYAALYRLEQSCPDSLLIERPRATKDRDSGLQTAILDRLRRACL
ncbi:MAG: L-threonylcarbamoyladenylate synthase [Myxococcota bacterium]